MEAVVQTTSREEIEQAVSAGGEGVISAISVVGKTVEEAAELRQYIPESVSGQYTPAAVYDIGPVKAPFCPYDFYCSVGERFNGVKSRAVPHFCLVEAFHFYENKGRCTYRFESIRTWWCDVTCAITCVASTIVGLRPDFLRGLETLLCPER